MFFKDKKLIAENQQLKKELEAFKTVQGELREEMLFIELDPQGRVRNVNDLFTQSTGHQVGDISAKHLSDLIPSTATSKAETQQMLKALKAHKHWHGAVSLLNASGNTIWVRGILQPVDDAYGNVSYITFYMSEQTKNISQTNELMDMVAALHRSSAVIEFSLDGIILNANDNFLQGMGYKLDQIVGKHHRIFCTQEEANSQQYKAFWQDLANGKLTSGRFKRIDSQGNDVWLEASYNPIHDENNKLYKIAKFATVITQQNAA